MWVSTLQDHDDACARLLVHQVGRRDGTVWRTVELTTDPDKVTWLN
jgi:hypothetical protein